MTPTLGERILDAPVKIQNMIFTHCLRRTYHEIEGLKFQPVPSLLAAFRADKQLYCQALELYYDINRIVVEYSTVFNFYILEPSTAALIHNMDIMLLYYHDMAKNTDDRFTGPYSKLFSASNLRSIEFHVYIDDEYPISIIHSCLELFPKLDSLKLVFMERGFRLENFVAPLAKLSQFMDGELDKKNKTEYSGRRKGTITFKTLTWSWQPLEPGVNRLRKTGQRILDLPVEIQNKIFAKCLWQCDHNYDPHGAWCCKIQSPFLLRAFRPDEELHQRVLKIFYDLYSFRLDTNERHHFEDLKPLTAGYIHHLQLEFQNFPSLRELYGYRPTADTVDDIFSLNATSLSKLPKASNLQTLRLLLRVDHPYTIAVIENCLGCFPKLNYLEITFWNAEHASDQQRLWRQISSFLDSKIDQSIRKLVWEIPELTIYPVEFCWQKWVWEVPAGYTIQRVGKYAETSRIASVVEEE